MTKLPEPDWDKVGAEHGIDPVAIRRFALRGEDAARAQLPGLSFEGRAAASLYLKTMSDFREAARLAERAEELEVQRRAAEAAEASADAARGANRRADQARRISWFALATSIAAIVVTVFVALMGGRA